MSLTDIRKNVCINAHCITRTKLIMGKTGKNSACAMDMILDELKSNNIEIDIETLLYSYDEYSLQQIVRRTIEDLRNIELEKYKVKQVITFKVLLGQLFIRLIFAYFT